MKIDERAIAIELMEHPSSKEHIIAKIIKNGRVYAATYAGKVDTDKVKVDYIFNPHKFLPFNETNNEYL
jgi:hypothetical protein